MRADCPANLVTLASGELACQDGMGGAVAWVEIPEFDVSQLEVEQLAGAFAAGFVVMGTAFVIGQGFRHLLDMIRRG